MRRAAGNIVLVLAVLVLCACGSIPQPYRSGPRTPANPLLEPSDGVGIRVAPVEGPTVPMARLLARSVADELKELEVPATAIAESASRYVLHGRTETNEGNAALPYILLIRWTLFDQTGEVVGTHTQGVEGTWWQWEYGDPRIIRAVGKGAAKPIAAMVTGEDDEPFLPTAPVGAALLVEPIEGAPGDGNRSLGRALRIALRTAGIILTDDRERADFVLHGGVDVGLPEGGRQRVRIVWTVSTPSGEQVGTATQENMVPAYSLDGGWGRVAVLAAAAALDGIERMLEPARADTARKFLPVTPPDRQLKQIPGRAPPPPQ
jgi:hypothetical protein